MLPYSIIGTQILCFFILHSKFLVLFFSFFQSTQTLNDLITAFNKAKFYNIVLPTHKYLLLLYAINI